MVSIYMQEKENFTIELFFSNIPDRYCIVVDDIWNASVWETIQFALIEDECRSRIITTTRVLDVAQKVGGVYELKPLSLDDSRKLFYLRVLGMVDKGPPKHLIEVSEKILRKCGGIPLAIVTIASMLTDKKGNAYKSWSRVCQSMGCGVDDSPDAAKMRTILSVSYYDLPPHLKTCFLYLSLYPEDCKIDKEDLVWKWIGEGFVLKHPGKTLYEVGVGYANELVNRSLIRQYSDIVDIVVCHDMILDLITYLSREDNFLITCGHLPMSLPDKVRRLSLQTSTEENIKKLSTMGLPQVRSLKVFSGAFNNLLPTISNFTVLRVLDLRECREVDNKYCKDICNQLHLRYLSLSKTSITEIPKEIKNLKFLQVLDISSNEIRQLPSTFAQLQQLVYLNVPPRTKLPDRFGNLKYLQELPQGISVKYPAMLHDICRLTELRALDIRFTEWDDTYAEPFLQWISNMVFLESLILRLVGVIDLRHEMLLSSLQQLETLDISARCCVPTVPKWMSSLNSLSQVTIKLLTLGEEDLHVLGSIPCLRYLRLSVREPTQDSGKKLVIGNKNGFACLTEFNIFSKPMKLVFTLGAMPKLQILQFRFGLWETMKQFDGFDFGLENLSSLWRVTIEMGVYNTKPQDVEAAEAAINDALDRNPNKPRPEWRKVTNFSAF